MDHFTYQQGALHAEEVPVEQIAAEVGSPFYCYSTATLRRHFKVFKESFAGLETKICYAVKANSNLAVIRTLAREGAGADVVSQGEIRLALAAGVAAGDIVFSGVAKTQDEMAYALEQGIFQFNVESEPELEALNAVAQGRGQQARIALRVNPDVNAGTHAKIATGGKEAKFGIPISQARELYRHASALPGIAVQGVSVHIGSQLTTLEPFRAAFRQVASLVEQLRSEGHAITTLDLGGGLGIPYSRGEVPPLPNEYGQMVKDTLGALDCSLIFEPGRMLVGNAGILVTRVIYVKETQARTFVIVDAGMNDLLRPAMYGAYHDIVPVRESAAAERVVDVVGPVCETGDILAEQRSLPLPATGDLLAVRSVGAYGAAMSNNYNTRLLVPEVLVNGAAYAVIRPRQSYEALIGRDAMPEWL